MEVKFSTAVTENHGVRTRDWRYIRYADGSEELYYHPDDPHEWTNLLAIKAGVDPAHRKKADELRTHIPKNNRQPAPNSAYRVLTYDPETQITTWEGKVIEPNEPIPEL